MKPRKRTEAIVWVLDRIADGTYKPGQSVLSGDELARIVDCHSLTGRSALRDLVGIGVLTRGVTPQARLRVAGAVPKQSLPDAVKALCEGLVTYRRKAGLTQPQLAELIGGNKTSVGHAETGRLWQSRDWWDLVDKTMNANGELLRLYDEFSIAQLYAGESRTSPTHEDN
jgi:DNA-binding transcriptional regulator YhcF (GntR family)